MLLKPFYVSLDLASNSCGTTSKKPLENVPTAKLPSINSGDFLLLSESPCVFFDFVTTFFWHPKHGSAESSIFEEPHILPQKKKTVPPNRNYPPNHPPVQVCQRASRNLWALLKSKGIVNKCLVNHKLKLPTNYWLILLAKSKGTNLICLGYFFQNGWRCFVLSLEVLGQIKLSRYPFLYDR